MAPLLDLLPFLTVLRTGRRDEGLVRERLARLDGDELHDLYRCTHLLSLCVLMWCVFIGHQLYLKWLIITGEADGSTLVLSAVGLAQFGNVAMAIYGAIRRSRVGWLHIWILALYCLPITPVGPLVSVISLYVLLFGWRLFGPNRFTHRQINGEVEYRKHGSG